MPACQSLSDSCRHKYNFQIWLAFPIIPPYLHQTHTGTGQKGVLLSSDRACHLPLPPRLDTSSKNCPSETLCDAQFLICLFLCFHLSTCFVLFLCHCKSPSFIAGHAYASSSMTNGGVKCGDPALKTRN